MKPLILAILPALAMVAQPSGRAGVKVGSGQTCFLTPPAWEGTYGELFAKINNESGGHLPTAESLNAMLNARNMATDGSRVMIPPPEGAPRIDFDTWVEGLEKQNVESVTTRFSSIRREGVSVALDRLVRDNLHHLYLRYSVVIERLPELGTYRVSFSDSVSAAAENLPAEWKMFSPPVYPVAQILRDGDTIALRLYGEATGPRLVEYIGVGQQAPTVRKEPARDIYSDDAEFAISQPLLRFNGIAAELAAGQPSQGPSLWFYLPGKGRFDLSFKPNPGLTLAGEVSGTSLVLQDDRNLLRLDSADRIAVAGSAIYRVYLRRDASWKPSNHELGSKAIISAGQ